MIQPLEYYTKRREDDLSPCPPSNGSSRTGYGRDAVAYWKASTCAYCGCELIDDYESWLHLSVDHVVPACVLKTWGTQYANWIGCRGNVVPCCRACNEFLNGYRVTGKAPKDEEAFIALRNRVLREKRDRALRRHEQEKLSYEQLRRVDAAASTLVPTGSDAIAQRITRSRIARLPSDVSFRC